MIKVLNVISDTNIGGAGKVILQFAKSYDKSKYEVGVVVPKGSALIEELKNTSVKIIEIDGLKDKSWDLKSLFKMIKVLKKEKPDIVHTHASSTARLAARFMRNVKIVYTRHCAYPVSNRIKKGIGHFLYKHINEFFADRIIAVGNAAEENLIAGGIDEKMIDTFYNGIEGIAPISDEEKRKLKEKYQIKENEKVIGIVARLEEVKGHDIFIDSAKILLDEKKINAKFLIVGTGSNEERLKQKVKELGLEKKIIFTGFLKNVEKIFNILDIQVNCSFGTEASSISLLEGMSLGVPTVASNYGGNPYVIQEGENGYLVPIKSANETAEAIAKILSSEEIRTNMEKRSVEIFKEKYTAEIFTKNVERVYEKVMQEPNKKRINPLDIFIVFIAIILGIVGYSYMKKGTVIVTPNTQKIVYQIGTIESLPITYQYIEEGSVLYDSIKNEKVGTVVAKEYKASEKTSVNEEAREIVLNQLEDRIDIVLTVEADAIVTEKDILVGNYVIKVGNDIYVKGKGYEVYGFIIGIER